MGDHDLLVGAGLAPVTDAALPAAGRRQGASVGQLDDHLITNEAGVSDAQPRAQSGWRGAYLQDPVSPIRGDIATRSTSAR